MTVAGGGPKAAGDLSVVIVSFNCRDLLLSCLTSLHGIDGEIIVVDNASSDQTVTTLRTRHPDVAVIEMGKNAGFGRASNRGMEAASGRYILLLNPDTVVSPGALRVLVDFLDEHPGAGVVAPRLVYPDGADQGTARAFPTAAAALFGRRSPLTRWFPSNRWSRRYLTGRQRSTNTPFEIEWVSGAAMMVRADVIGRLGGFDPDFFMHWEDAELCHRTRRSGFEIWCEPRATVIHEEGGSRRGWPPRQVWHFHRGAYLFWKKTHTGWSTRVTLPLVAGALLARAAIIIARDTARGAFGGFRQSPLGSPSPRSEEGQRSESVEEEASRRAES